MERAPLDSDLEPGGGWDTARGLTPLDASERGMEGLLAQAEAVAQAGVEEEADASDYGPGGRHPLAPLDLILPLPHPPRWRWLIWKAWRRASRPS